MSTFTRVVALVAGLLIPLAGIGGAAARSIGQTSCGTYSKPLADAEAAEVSFAGAARMYHTQYVDAAAVGDGYEAQYTYTMWQREEDGYRQAAAQASAVYAQANATDCHR